MLDKRTIFGIIFLFAGFTVMVQEKELGFLLSGIGIMALGLYWILDGIK